MKRILIAILVLASILIFASCEISDDIQNNEYRTPNSDCNHNYVLRSKTDPGCESEGVEIRYCTICSDVVRGVSPAIGHDYESCEISPTCESDGSEYVKCKNCGDIVETAVLSKLSHE